MKYANKLTKEQLKNFLESYNKNIKVKSIESELPCKDGYISYTPVMLITVNTEQFEGLNLYFSDTDFRFGTTPILYEDKKLTTAWRSFLAKTFEKENYVDFLKEELTKQIEALKQEKEQIK